MTPHETQLQQILSHLHSTDRATRDTMGLSPLEALGLYRVQRLAARICDLRDIGHEITSIRKKDRTGKTYARYYLASNQHSYQEGTVFSLPRNRRG